jgi:phage tail-like protein
MDVNGLPMWLFADERAFGVASSAAEPNVARNLRWSADRDYLTLAAQQDPPAIEEQESFARSMRGVPSPVSDDAGTFAWWNSIEQQIEASGFAPESIAIHLGPDNAPELPKSLFAPTDMALGDDQILRIAREGKVILRDLRTRYPTSVAERAGFSADLLAPRAGGAWAFDRATRRLAIVEGVPLRPIGIRPARPDHFEPIEPNPNPPRVKLVTRARIPARFDVVAIAASMGGKLALLAWETGADAAIFTLEEGRFVLRGRTANIRFPWSIAWVGEASVALMASDGAAPAKQAYVYPVDQAATPTVAMPPEGRTHLLRDPWPGGFCNRLGTTPSYLTKAAGIAIPASMRRLLPLSGHVYARSGEVLIGPIDSGETGCVWHRLYAEASIPGHARIRASIWASDARATPALPGEEDAPDWAAHLIGTPDPEADDRALARAAWCAEASEVAAHPGLLDCPRVPDRAGLFTVLVQHPARRVRRVAGRYAWLHLQLEGDSRVTPELAALRLYARRFSYRDRYLPDFYSETLGGDDALAKGPATPPDFLDRTLGLFEGSLTELEGRIAGSWLLTDPAAAPAPALPWIGSWIGVAAMPHDNDARLRQKLIAAPFLARLHGTLGGLMAALEIATGGQCVVGGSLDPDTPPDRQGTLVIARLEDIAVRALLLGRDEGGRFVVLTGGAITRGDIVVVEGFRMRRTFATILGADLADEDDPLTLGLAVSGNSYVGDTLILGDQASVELLALYRSEITAAKAENDGIERFFAELAHRVLVLVRGVNDAAEMRRLGDVIAEAIPAHVEAQMHSARTPLIVGAASLVGLDTYLVDRPEIERVRLNRTLIGSGDQVRGEGWLDGRADGPMSPAPRGVAEGPGTAWTGKPFILSALKSTAAANRAITRYVWTWQP